MSLIANPVVKRMATELAVYTAVDSLKEKQLDFSGVPVNAIAIAGYELVIKNFVYGRLAGLIDGSVSDFIEDYVGKFAGLYAAEMFMGKARDVQKVAKDQLYYSLAGLLTSSAYSQFGLNRVVDPRSATTQGSTYRA